MILPILVTLIIILGTVVSYIYYLGPKLNPVNRAQNFLDENQVEEAILEYKKILDKNPSNFFVHYKLGELYFKQGMIDQGVVHFEEILKIGKFNHEVDKITVQRILARSYLGRDELEKGFETFFEIARVYPGDIEALYQVAFISLGQEAFEVAFRFFERLVKLNRDAGFEIYFGAGMAAYQNQKNNEAAEYFREALAKEPHSEIANIAMAFTQWKRRDFKTGINYAKMVVDSSKDESAVMVAKRLLAILYMQAERSDDAVRELEELLEILRQNELEDEISLILYDLGFVSLKGEKTQLAYDYWNRLYQKDRNYGRIQHLVTLLRKEMDSEERKKLEPAVDSVLNYSGEWLKETFPGNFVWKICGLKNKNQFDIKSILARARVSESRGGQAKQHKEVLTGDESEKLNAFFEMDVENFRIISNRMVEKMGYSVDEILPTYREADGVDFMARVPGEKKKVLVWVRRWRDTRVGEIPLRNFAQAINDAKAGEGLFFTTSDLTPSAEGALSRLSKVTVIYPDQIGDLLAGLIR